MILKQFSSRIAACAIRNGFYFCACKTAQIYLKRFLHSDSFFADGSTQHKAHDGKVLMWLSINSWLVVEVTGEDEAKKRALLAGQSSSQVYPKDFLSAHRQHFS